MIEELYNKIDKFCNETDWSKYLTYEHALEEFIKEIVEEETKELEKENAELKDDNKVMADNYSKMEQKFFDNLTKAKEILKAVVDFYPTMTATILLEAEQFLNSEVEK